MQKPKEHYLVYCRKSSESEDRQVQSIEDQRKILTQLAEDKNIKILKLYKESRSAKAPGRELFNEMVETIKKRGDIKGIFAWSVSRLTRNPVDTGALQWLLQQGTIDEIITPTKTYTEVDSDFIMAVEGAQANRFIRDLRRDTLRGIQSKLDKGIAPILAPPGYRNAVEKRQGERDIEPHPTQFPLVRRLFEYFMTGSFSVQSLCYKAEEIGVRSNRGKIVSRTQLYEMLKNPFYTGIRFIYGEKLYTNGAHKRMLTDEEFDLIQDTLSKRTHPRGIIHKDLLTGLMVCGECGRSITSEVKTKHYKNGNSQTFTYYRCTKKWTGKKCLQKYLSGKDLETQVLDYLDGLELSPRFIEWAIKWLNVMHKSQAEVREAKYKQIEQNYQDTVKKLERLVDLMLSDVITSEEGKLKKQELASEKQRYWDQLQKIDTHVSEWNNLAIETFNFVKNLKEKFSEGTIEQKKTILRVIGSNLVLKDKKLTIQVRKPFEYIRKAATELSPRNRLEPTELAEITSQTAFLNPQSAVLGG